MTRTIPAPQTAAHRIEDFLDVVRVAVAIVARRVPAHVDRDDLASVGHLRLVQLHARAPAAFAEARAWLLCRVAHAMRDELRRSDGLGRRARRHLRAIEDARIRLAAAGNRSPSEVDLGREAGISLRVVRRTLRVTELSHSTPLDEVGDQVADADTATPAQVVVFEDLARSAGEALQRLPVAQRSAVILTVIEGDTLMTAAAKLGCSISGVAKHRDQGLRALRSHITSAPVGA